MGMATGSRTEIGGGLANDSSGSWVSCALFCGRSGFATIRAYGTFGGGTVTIRTAADSSGLGAATLDGISLTADGSAVVHVAWQDYIQAVVTGGSGETTVINVTGSPHDRL